MTSLRPGFIVICAVTLLCILAKAAHHVVANSLSPRAGRNSDPLSANATFATLSDDPPTRRQTPKYEPAVLRGKVVELGPHAMQVFHVPMDDDLGKGIVALVSDSGEVHPLIKDVRSRGFFMDKRLRDRPMELHVLKYPGLPFVRLIDVYSFKDGKKYKPDYWCTICAITTYQPGPCPCCQDEIQLRERPVEEIKPGQ